MGRRIIGSIPLLQIYSHSKGSMRVSGKDSDVFATLGCSRIIPVFLVLNQYLL